MTMQEVGTSGTSKQLHNYKCHLPHNIYFWFRFFNLIFASQSLDTFQSNTSLKKLIIHNSPSISQSISWKTLKS